MKLKQLYYLSVSLLVSILLTSCDPWGDDTKLIDENVDKSLYEVVQANGELSVFANILQKTGYDEIISAQPALTVFAPNNNALNGLDQNDLEELKNWVQNYIAYLSHYTNNEGGFEVEEVQMLNGKSVKVNVGAISGTNIAKHNLLATNGVLHIIDGLIEERMSIWEYMQKQTGSMQVDFISSYYENVIDMDKSTVTGVNENGQQVYDTVWMVQNTFLNDYPIDNERNTFTVILLEDEAFVRLETKYNKYLAQPDSAAQKKEVLRQLSSDLILEKQTLSEAHPDRYLSVNSLLVDIDPQYIKEVYQASNGWVYKMSTADIKIYNNKIKEQIIEAEDYTSRYDGSSTDPLTDKWIRRARSYASGGYDMVLKGRTENKVSWSYLNEADSLITGIATYEYRYPYRSGQMANQLCRHSNAYIEYKPTLHSVGYNIYWMSYPLNSDFNEITTSGLGIDSIIPPMELEQKLFISFPGAEMPLNRNSDGLITGNFSTYSVMAGKTTAGVLEETKLTRYRANSGNDGYYMLTVPYTSDDDFGTGDFLKSPSYGTATFYVANTARNTGDLSGMVYLDYIRIVPLVDPND